MAMRLIAHLLLIIAAMLLQGACAVSLSRQAAFLRGRRNSRGQTRTDLWGQSSNSKGGARKRPVVRFVKYDAVKWPPSQMHPFGIDAHRHSASAYEPNHSLHSSAYHSVPSGNLDTEELKRRTEQLIAARQREIQSQINSTISQMQKKDISLEDAQRNRQFEAAETIQQLAQAKTHHLPGMETEPRHTFDPRKDPLWNIVMRQKRTGSAYRKKSVNTGVQSVD